MSKDYLLIIDGSSLLSTQFYGNLPREVLMGKTVEDKEKFYHKIMKTSTGVYTNGVFGFLRVLFSIIEKQKPSHIAVTWDLTRNTFRRELYSEYKANRSETIEPLKQQFELCQKVLARMGIVQLMDERYEADDYSGSLSKKYSKDIPVCIMTKDHDYLQLVDDNVILWLIMSDQAKADAFFSRHSLAKADYNLPDKTIPLNRELVKSEFGIYPESVPSLKGLMGDSADNIKGVPGIGDKTATALISYYHNIDSLYDEINNAQDKKMLAMRWKNELGISRNPIGYLTKPSDTELVGENAARLSEKLATIITDLDINKSLDDLTLDLNILEAGKVLNELEIHSLKVPKVGSIDETADMQSEFEKRLVIIDNLMSFLEQKEGIIDRFREEELGLHVIADKGVITSWSVCNGLDTLLVKAEGFLSEELMLELLNEILIKCKKVYCFDFKSMLRYVSEDTDFTDCAILEYLLNPLSSNHGYHAVFDRYSLAFDKDYDEAALSSYTAINYHQKLEAEIDEAGMTKLYCEIEKPLVRILSSMENIGICCSEEELNSQGDELRKELKKCEERIFNLSGEHFNILSPKQLGEVLFDKLKLPGGKKNKSGYSTSADVLEKLAPDYEIVGEILYYRQLSKLISTYIDGLKGSIRPDGRIHCTFNQMVTATGRLSCTEPNLQNIPIRDELGRRIRKAFVPKGGCVFVDADYSQIELRVMAHMAGDEKLIDDYKNARDIHRTTASNVFGVPYDEVTSKQRRDAKAVNFGIIYGISSFGLGQDLDISRKQAGEYIEAYFREYPQIKAYLDNLVNSAKTEENVKTLFGRVRPVPEIKSSNFMQRSFGERIAMNSPIQGTAADIMKIAMIRVYNALKDKGLEARMLLQIHDEILIEAPESEKEEVQEILKTEMKAAVKLKVDLEVESGCADNWYALK